MPTDVTEPQRPSMTPGNWELVEMCLTDRWFAGRHVASQSLQNQVEDVSPLLPSYLLHLTRARPHERRWMCVSTAAGAPKPHPQ